MTPPDPFFHLEIPMEFMTHLIALAVGVALGLMAYRYQLKRNPEKLEAWARQIKLAREAAEAKLRERK